MNTAVPAATGGNAYYLGLRSLPLLPEMEDLLGATHLGLFGTG